MRLLYRSYIATNGLILGRFTFQRTKRLRKNTKIFGRILRTFSQNFFCDKAKMRNAKNIFEKCKNFDKTMSFIAATVDCLKELFSDSSIFEVLLCHTNNLSSFTYIYILVYKCLIKRFWFHFDFTSYLFYVSVCPSTIHMFNRDYEPANYKKI